MLERLNSKLHRKFLYGLWKVNIMKIPIEVSRELERAVKVTALFEITSMPSPVGDWQLQFKRFSTFDCMEQFWHAHVPVKIPYISKS